MYDYEIKLFLWTWRIAQRYNNLKHSFESCDNNNQTYYL